MAALPSINDSPLTAPPSAGEDVHLTGSALVHFVNNHPADKGGVTFKHTLDAFNQLPVNEEGSNVLASYHVQALRAALLARNYEIVRLLLDSPRAPDSLSRETDILHVIISAQNWRLAREPKAISETVELLITHGAVVNALDEKGNSPLHCACTLGFSLTFKTLIDNGAEVTWLYDPFPSQQLDSPEVGSVSRRSDKDNLLKITLDARLAHERGGPISHIWKDDLRNKFGPIIIFLLGVGLTVEHHDPCLIKFLHIACSQGNLEYVEKLLSVGVDINASAARSDDRDYVFPAALHVATLAGETDVASCLLQHGADPQAKRDCKTLKGREPLTPIALALTWAQFDVAKRPNALDCCEMLVNVGVGEDDRQLVLTKCISSGDVERAKRLLQRGIRIPEVPLCTNQDIVQMLLDNGSKIDSAMLQRYAAEEGAVDLLRFLVHRDGSTLRIEEDSGVPFPVLRRNAIAMLRYLIKEYGYDANATFPLYAGAKGSRTNLLQRACKDFDAPKVQFLLENGADPQCPGLPDTIIEFFRNHVKSYSIGWGFAATNHPLIQLLRGCEMGKREQRLDMSPVIPVRSHLEHQSTSLTAPEWSSDSENTEDGLDRTGRTASKTEAEVGKVLQNDHPMPQIIPLNKGDDFFQYQPLDKMQAIRLLKLEPSNSTSTPIQCRLIHVYLSQEPRYEALSYVWGDTSHKIPISLQDCVFQVTKNLWSALGKLRLENDTRMLWIDAICINQSDIEEKSRQVSMIGEIYGSATQVVIWLGEEADDSHLVFEYPRKMERYHEEKKARGNCGSYDPCDGEWVDLTFPPPLRPSDALCKLYQRPWFYRTWIIQECSVSKKAVVMCGRDTADFNEILRPSSFNPAEASYHPIRGADAQSHCKQLLDVRNRSYVGLNEIFLVNRLCQVSDPRDKIYGILGLFQCSPLAIDYSLSVADVFRNFTQVMIESTQELKVLHLVGTQNRTNDLPSWVPDYAISKPTGVLPRIYGSGFYYLNFPGKTKPEFRDNDLVIQGRYLEKIQAAGPELLAEVAYSPGRKRFARVLFEWEHLALKLENKRFHLTVVEAFSDTLITADNHDSLRQTENPRTSWSAHNFITWYSRYGTGMLGDANRSKFEEVEDTLRWLGKPYLVEKVEADVRAYTTRMERACYGRKFFITDHGSMGLAPPRAQDGDEIVHFPGGWYPFVVRRRVDGTSELIGDCFLYDWRVYQLLKEGGKESTEFVIR